MTNFEVFIREFLAVNRNTTGAVVSREVTALGHEVLNYTMENAAFVGILVLVVAGTQRSEVFSCLWYVVRKKLDLGSISLFLPRIGSRQWALRSWRS